MLHRIIESGRLRPVIDRTYPLSELGGHHYVEQGHKRGNVVITVAPELLSAGGFSLSQSSQTQQVRRVKRSYCLPFNKCKLPFI